MNILRIIASMDPAMGGPCQGIRNSIPALKELGVNNEVVCFDTSDSDFLKDDEFKVHALGPAVGPYSYCSGYSKWLQNNLIRFDVLIIHGVWLYNSYGTFRVWKELKRKGEKVPSIFMMPHGMLDPYFQKSKERKLKAIRNSLFWHLFEKRVVNGSNGILFTCEMELLLARETFKDYHPRTELNIGYGIQAPPVLKRCQKGEFYSKCPEVIDRPYWLFLSRIHSKKGVDLLIKAYYRIKEKFDSVPDLVIAGPGIDTGFGRQIRSMGADSQIHFPGMLTGAAKWEAFYDAQAFVLPSHQENFGIAVVEALACATPVIISKKVNIWKEIISGKGGVICDDTEEGIYNALIEWKKIPKEEKKNLSTNASQIYRSHFTVETAARKMVSSLAKENCELQMNSRLEVLN